MADAGAAHGRCRLQERERTASNLPAQSRLRAMLAPGIDYRARTSCLAEPAEPKRFGRSLPRMAG
jgi:hypothetical protein